MVSTSIPWYQTTQWRNQPDLWHIYYKVISTTTNRKCALQPYNSMDTSKMQPIHDVKHLQLKNHCIQKHDVNNVWQNGHGAEQNQQRAKPVFCGLWSHLIQHYIGPQQPPHQVVSQSISHLATVKLVIIIINNTWTAFMVLLSRHTIAKVHPVHLRNVEKCQHAANLLTTSTDLGRKSACGLLECTVHPPLLVIIRLVLCPEIVGGISSFNELITTKILRAPVDL